MHFDPTITIGNAITIILATLALVFAWRDMDWRVKNLEKWRIEQVEWAKTQTAMYMSLSTSATQFSVLLKSLQDQFELWRQMEAKLHGGRKQ